MNLGKRLMAVFGTLAIIGAVTAAVVSGGNGEANTLRILFVPSNQASEVMKESKRLEGLLHDELLKEGFDKKVNIGISKDYNSASRAVKAGNAAIGYIPTLAYFDNSIAGNDNLMHQLFQTKRNALLVEYHNANDQEDVMNQQGTVQTFAEDEQNIFNIVKGYGPVNSQQEVDSGANDGISATYYRQYSYIRKDTLKEYYDSALNGTNNELKAAWQKLVIVDPNNSNRAIFNDDVETNATTIQQYWKVAWDIFARSIGHIGIAGDRNSSAGRIMPINSMIGAYLKANGLDENNQKDVDQAGLAVNEILKNYYSLGSYSNESVTNLIEKKIKVGVGFADARTQYKGVYSVPEALDQITIFNASHGIINDGAVYSTKHFGNRMDYLKAVQDAFVNLIKTKEGQKLFFEIYHHTDYMPSNFADSEWMNNYEKKIADAQAGMVALKAKEVSNSLAN